jgi:L-lactate utilization protein LutC
VSEAYIATSRETGDRDAFLARLRGRLAHGVPADLAHPMPGALDAVPIARSSLVDRADLLSSFRANATAARATVHRVDGDRVPGTLLATLVDDIRVRSAVVTAEPAARALVDDLRALGVDVEELSVGAAARVDLGVTSAVGAIATTGTLVLASDVSGGRTASLLPPSHLCVLPASAVVAGSDEVLRGLGTRASRLPSNLVLVTGPSRSGDIEQIIALGVHGPLRVEIVLLERC